ncbi:MAG: DEAD/DEAH box helicase [Ignavibacteriales bacterium]|nr:MAG: DEAD/DEAH box helicase [Ignavibacteriales bacterium]
MLNVDRLVESLSKNATYKKIVSVPFDMIKELPKISKIKLTGIDKIKISMFVAKNIQPITAKVKKNSFIQFNKSVISDNKFKVPHAVRSKSWKNLIVDPEKAKEKKSDKKSLEHILQSVLNPSMMADMHSADDMLIRLYNYQRDDVQTLIENNYVLFADEYGTGKTVSTIAAIKLLLKKGRIKNVLIVSPSYFAGDNDLTERTGMPIGWSGHLNMWAPELSISDLSGTEDEILKGLKKSSQVYFTTYETFYGGLDAKILDSEKFKKIDCLIFDDVQNLAQAKHKLGKLFGSIKTKYIWCLSNMPLDKIQDEIEGILKPVISAAKSYLVASRKIKTDLAQYTPPVMRQDYWVPLDDVQKIEYDNTLELGRERIIKLVDAGNPFLIQSNVFTLLHQLKQVCNFGANAESSGKSELLQKHMDIIVKNNKKVVIFSQYDKLGVKRIESLFKKLGINFVSYQSGMSMKEMESAIKSFSTDKSVTAFIAGVKTDRVKVNLGQASYLINFDQWWNPVSTIKTEENVNNPDKNNPAQFEMLNSINYFVKGTIEEKIKEMLFDKGLGEENIIEFLTPEMINDLITNDEWLKILDVASDYDKSREEAKIISTLTKIQKFSNAEFIEKSIQFFTKLGYKNLKSEPTPIPNDINISGSAVKFGQEVKLSAKCLTTENADAASINSYLRDEEEKNPKGKIFILTPALFEEDSLIYHRKNVTVLPGNLLSKYYSLFKVI